MPFFFSVCFYITNHLSICSFFLLSLLSILIYLAACIMFIYLFVYQNIHLSIWLFDSSFCLSIYLSVCLSIYLSIHLAVFWMSTNLSYHSKINLSIIVLYLWDRSFCQQSSISWWRASGQSMGAGNRKPKHEKIISLVFFFIYLMCRDEKQTQESKASYMRSHFCSYYFTSDSNS